MSESEINSNGSYTTNSSEEVLSRSPEILDVVWSPGNVAEYGSPAEAYPERNIRYHLYPTWRSQFGNLILFFLTSLVTIIGSNWSRDTTVIHGELFTIGGTTFYLYLPLLIFLPGFVLGKILVRAYDSEYIIDGRGIEAKVGLVSLMLRQPRMRFEDVRGVEPSQTIWERLLNIGHLEIGSAMKDDVEITMQGISNPRAVQLFISGEIERSLRRITQSTNNNAGLLVARSD